MDEKTDEGKELDGALDELPTDEVQSEAQRISGSAVVGEEEGLVVDGRSPARRDSTTDQEPPTMNSLPPPLPDRAEDNELERRIRDFTRGSAQETLRLCGDLLGKRPERALNLLELYVHASRKLLVELAEPEDDLHRTADRMPRLGRPRVDYGEDEGGDIAMTNPYRGARQGRGGFRDAALLAEAQGTLLRRDEEGSLVPLARTYAAGLRMVLARAQATGEASVGPMLEAVKAELGEELAKELLDVFAPVRVSREEPPLSPEEAAADLSEPPQDPFEALVEEQGLEFVPQIPADLELRALSPTFDELLDGGAPFRLERADAELTHDDEEEIDRALAEDDEEEAADEDEAIDSDEETMMALGLGRAGGDQEVLRLLRRQVRLKRRITRRNIAIENPYFVNTYR